MKNKKITYIEIGNKLFISEEALRVWFNAVTQNNTPIENIKKWGITKLCQIDTE